MWRILSLTPDEIVKNELDALARAGPHRFEIDHAKNIEEVVQASAVNCFNAYILDCSIDWPKPLSLCNLIRSWNPECLIIIMSLEEADREDALQAGANMFLRRPSDSRKLGQTIENFIR